MKRNNSFDGVFRVVSVGQEQIFKSGFRKIQMLVTDDDPKYPVVFPVEWSGDRVDKALAFQNGDHVAITFSIQGHEYNGRHFTTLRGWKIERAVKLGGESKAVPNAEAVQTPAAPVPPPPQPTLFDAQAERPAPVVPDDPGANIEDIPF